MTQLATGQQIRVCRGDVRTLRFAVQPSQYPDATAFAWRLEVTYPDPAGGPLFTLTGTATVSAARFTVPLPPIDPTWVVQTYGFSLRDVTNSRLISTGTFSVGEGQSNADVPPGPATGLSGVIVADGYAFATATLSGLTFDPATKTLAAPPAGGTVRFDVAQSLTTGQQGQARGNIGLGSAAVQPASAFAAAAHTHAYSSLTGLPTLGGAAALNVGTAAGTVAAGDHTHAGVYQPAGTYATGGGTATGTNTGDQDLSGLVPKTTTVNGQPLSANVTIQNVTGNAGTASKLAAARSLNGAAFDGSADATVPVPLARTGVKTAAYAAAAGDLVPCDTTAAGFTVTLPTAPPDKSLVCVKHVVQGGANAVTVACGGSDVLNRAGGPAGGTLSLANQAFLLQYAAGAGVWTVLADDLPLSALDGRYTRYDAAQGLTAGQQTQARANLNLGPAALLAVPIPVAAGGTGADLSAAAGVPVFAAGAVSVAGTTGSGNVVRDTSPTVTAAVVTTTAVGTSPLTLKTLAGQTAAAVRVRNSGDTADLFTVLPSGYLAGPAGDGPGYGVRVVRPDVPSRFIELVPSSVSNSTPLIHASGPVWFDQDINSDQRQYRVSGGNSVFDAGFGWGGSTTAKITNGSTGFGSLTLASLTAAGPVAPGTYTFATLPSAAANARGVVVVSDRGGRPAYSDGSNWKWMSDDTTVT